MVQVSTMFEGIRSGWTCVLVRCSVHCSALWCTTSSMFQHTQHMQCQQSLLQLHCTALWIKVSSHS
jgi:hypothetical protein